MPEPVSTSPAAEACLPGLGQRPVGVHTSEPQTPHRRLLQVQVRLPDGRTLLIVAPAKSTVTWLKQHIFDREAISVSEKHLRCETPVEILAERKKVG